MEVITIAQAKQVLRIDESYTLENALIQDIIDASVDWCERYTGLTFGLKTLTAYTSKTAFEIPYGPVKEILSVKDVDGNDSGYVRKGFQHPTIALRGIDVEIVYTAGFESGLPASLVSAVKMMVATLYENRESYAVGERGITLIEMPIGITDLLRPYSRSGGLFL